MSATITCSDWTDSHNNVHKGCGATLRWPTDEERRVSGSKKPVNPDGSPHNHNSAPKQAPKAPATATGTSSPAKPAGTNGRDRPYYEGIEEVALETDVKSVNTYLKSGWVILRIAERQGYAVGAGQQALSISNLSTGSGPSPVMAVSEIVFCLGRRAA